MKLRKSPTRFTTSDPISIWGVLATPSHSEQLYYVNVIFLWSCDKVAFHLPAKKGAIEGNRLVERRKTVYVVSRVR